MEMFSRSRGWCYALRSVAIWNMRSKMDTTLRHRGRNCISAHTKSRDIHNTHNLGVVFAQVVHKYVAAVKTSTLLIRSYALTHLRYRANSWTLAQLNALESYNTKILRCLLLKWSKIWVAFNRIRFSVKREWKIIPTLHHLALDLSLTYTKLLKPKLWITLIKTMVVHYGSYWTTFVINNKRCDLLWRRFVVAVSFNKYTFVYHTYFSQST